MGSSAAAALSNRCATADTSDFESLIDPRWALLSQTASTIVTLLGVTSLSPGAGLEKVPGMDRKLVLVLEQDQVLLESVRHLAERLGYRVATARSLSEARSVIAR